MGYFSVEEMLSLTDASNKYKKQLDYEQPRPLDPNKLKFEEFSSILESKGWPRNKLNADEHVVNYIFSDPSRHSFVDLLDEEIPQALLPIPEYSGIPGLGVAKDFIKDELITTAFAIAPGAIVNTVSNLEETSGLTGYANYFDWKEFGRYAWEDSWDAASLITKFGTLLKDAKKNKLKDETQDTYSKSI